MDNDSNTFLAQGEEECTEKKRENEKGRARMTQRKKL